MPRTNSSSPHARGLLGLVAVTTPRFPPARQLPHVGVGFRHGKLLEAQQARSYFSRIRSWTPPIVLPGHTRRLCRGFNGGGGTGVGWIRAPEQPLRQHQRVRVEQAGPHQSYAFTYHQLGKTKKSRRRCSCSSHGNRDLCGVLLPSVEHADGISPHGPPCFGHVQESLRNKSPSR